MFDLHVHGAPDLWPRRGGDADLVRDYAAAGYSGCVLKGHYESTVGRAAAVTGPITVYGGLALNQHAGGINPAAVAAALAMGGRVIWLPTSDAHTQAAAGLPRLCGVRTEQPATTYAIPPVDDSMAGAVQEILALIAEFDAVLATGHLSAAEIGWLMPRAVAAGVQRILLTHPSYTVPAMTAAQTARFTAAGAYAEVTAFQLLHQPGMDAAALAAFVRAVGPDRVVLSSDAGQPDSPPPPQALGMLLDALVAEGMDRAELVRCAADIPAQLVTP